SGISRKPFAYPRDAVQGLHPPAVEFRESGEGPQLLAVHQYRRATASGDLRWIYLPADKETEIRSINVSLLNGPNVYYLFGFWHCFVIGAYFRPGAFE